MATVQDYYNLLVRLQHPVFRKDFAFPPAPDSSFHLVRNYLIAKQLVKLKTKVDSLEENSFPHTVNQDGISRWETDYFDFNKPSLPIEQRRSELLKWINSKVGMALPDVQNAAVAITGQLPAVILKVNKGGWTLGKAPLGKITILGGQDTTENRYTYLVKFTSIVNSALLKTLDNELTRIEKAGSKHIISAPKVKWILGKSALGADTFLRN
jgi:hypothetical protein